MSEKVAEQIDGWSSMAVSQTGWNSYTVSSWRNDELTAHVVQLDEPTCTCEDYEYNKEGEEACAHIIKATFVANSTRSASSETVRFASAQATDVKRAAERIEQVATSMEAHQQSGGSQTASEPVDSGSPGSTVPEPEEQVEKVEGWVRDQAGSLDGVSVSMGEHGTNTGIIVDPDKREMANAVYDGLSDALKDADWTEMHVGFGDDPCNTCGESDGDFWFFAPSHRLSEVDS